MIGEKHNQGHFGFSAVPLNDLNNSEYTLATIVIDESGSVSSFAKDMEACMQEIIGACLKSPRANNLLLRLVAFSSGHREVHGFKKLSDVNVGDYNGFLQTGGSTALFDACVDSIEASNKFGKQMISKDMSVNGIVFVITDGCDNCSRLPVTEIKNQLASAVSGEILESMVSVLITVGMNSGELDYFNQEVGFTSFVKITDASKGKLAKLAQFVSKSISSQSQGLGSGAQPTMPQSLTF
jgi:uncharacterized protein YegL